jgi:hypothetical protein
MNKPSEDFVILLENLVKEISDLSSDRSISSAERNFLREIVLKNYLLLEGLQNTEDVHGSGHGEEISLQQLILNSKQHDREFCRIKKTGKIFLTRGKIGTVWKWNLMLNIIPGKDSENKIVRRISSLSNWGSDSLKGIEWLLKKILFSDKGESKSFENKPKEGSVDRDGYEFVWGEK